MKRPLYGLLAEFKDPDELVAAAEAVHKAGYVHVDAYTPFPLEGLHHALGIKHSRLPKAVFVAAVLGLLTAYGLQTWVHVFEYPINSGGRPNHSWPAFLPVMFELTILFAAVFTVVLMLAANGLPRPHHPLFASPRFDFASQSYFFLCIEARDPSFDLEKTRALLAKYQPQAIEEVPS